MGHPRARNSLPPRHRRVLPLGSVGSDFWEPLGRVVSRGSGEAWCQGHTHALTASQINHSFPRAVFVISIDVGIGYISALD